jgi:pimeloyl-ACP methyl ester carboxylesterase
MSSDILTRREGSTTPDLKKPRLAYQRVGQGEPLVLLHGQGLSRHSWDPVLPQLAAARDVIAIDLPGHGESPRQPRNMGSAPAGLAITVAELLDELSLAAVHLAGNSLGGWVALELARQGRAKTVTALAPAGLWRRSAPRHVRFTLRQAGSPPAPFGASHPPPHRPG